ncbi:hypothetical protein [Fodinicola feengrottensis]|uniref:hypothetical protein n=1 Tax=Fodinicola feengrottensis TaxID=435914 RepID=UPI002441778F|nr:hypothetical protein [Fodinicola feengrottensis]
MTTTLVRRPARIAPPAVPADRVQIAEPPHLQAQPPASMSASMVVMPVISGCGSLLVAVTNPDKPLFAVAPACCCWSAR